MKLLFISELSQELEPNVKSLQYLFEQPLTQFCGFVFTLFDICPLQTAIGQLPEETAVLRTCCLLVVIISRTTHTSFTQWDHFHCIWTAMLAILTIDLTTKSTSTWLRLKKVLRFVVRCLMVENQRKGRDWALQRPPLHRQLGAYSHLSITCDGTNICVYVMFDFFCNRL